jgi:spore coat polysaccharide biosynthesis protein SpsF (cytidylyltransferase family)
MVNPNIIIVTQARIGSTRFPGKVLKALGDGTMLSTHLNRLKMSKRASNIIVATTFEVGVEEIVKIANQLKIDVYQGSTTDVLDRFYQAVYSSNPDYVVRVTSDCPLIDAALIDEVIEMVISKQLDYGSNMLIEEYPDGQDVEVFTFKALERAWKEATLESEREHVTPYIRNNASFNSGSIFKSDNYKAPISYNHIRMTVDEPADLATIEEIIKIEGTEKDWLTYTNFILNNSAKLNNQQITRNEGYLKSLKKESNGQS